MKCVFNSCVMPAWFALALSLVVQATADERVGQFVVHEGLAFSDAAPKLRLDLYLPSEARKPAACVIVIQGGGFMAQDGKRFRPFAVYLAEHGFAAALISYRGRPNDHYRDTVADVKSAVRFVRRTSSRYNLDPNRLGAMGRSAGGTLAALLAVTDDKEDRKDADGTSEPSSRVHAAVAFAGVFDFVSRFTDQNQRALQPRLETKMKTNGDWVGTPFSPTNQDWLNASAIQHVDEHDPPMLFIHCKDDATVPWQQSRDMCEKMREAGVSSACKLYETGGHGFRGLGEKPMAEMVRFFEKTL